MIKLNYPPFVHWEVTPMCNHNCIHCYNYWRKDNEKLDDIKTNMTKQDYLSIAKKIVENKAVTVVITGGEPFIVFDEVKSSIEYLLENKINISINTNIALLNEEILAFVKKNKISLFISFPCGNENICNFLTGTSNSFNKILEKLDMLFQNDVKFMLNVVVSKINIKYVMDTVLFLKKRYNISKIYLTRVGKPINSDDSFDKYLLDSNDICALQDICVKTKLEYNIDVDTGCPFTLCSINSKESFELFAYKKLCTAGKTSYSVDTFGNVKACPRDNTIYGNLLKESFFTIWDKIEPWRNESLLPEECKSCNLKNVCMGGCRVDSQPFTHNLSSLDTTANLNNIPIKYVKKAVSPNLLSINDVFTVNDIIIVKETVGYRLSFKKSYLFSTDKLTDFIINNKTFSTNSFMTYFSVDIDKASFIISRLLKNKIIKMEVKA